MPVANLLRHVLRALACGLLATGFCLPANAASPIGLRIDAPDLSRLRMLDPEQGTVLRLQANAIKTAPEVADEAEWAIRRVEVYAADAQLWIATEHGLEPAPRSDLLHFIATRGDERLALSMAPNLTHGTGLLLGEAGSFSLTAHARSDGSLMLDGTPTDTPLADGTVPQFDCLGGFDVDQGRDTSATLAKLGAGASPKVAARRVTLAIDTDNELMLEKFSNNTSAASNYLAQLVLGMSAIYEKEPGDGGARLKLELGSSILRPSTTTDPYPSTSTTPIGSQLDEFGNYWAANYSGTARAFALLISGKSPGAYSAQGMAWLLTSGTYCSRTASYGGHYSVSRVFKYSGATAANDVSLVAHELGHNFGLDHTHCTAAGGGGFLDQCYSGEGSGCYVGPTSCPAPGSAPGAPKGTLMSYCHVNSCGANVQQVHPTQVITLNSRIDSQPPSCVVPISSPVNQAPSISAPSSITVTEDVATALAGISFADPDAGSGSLTASFNVPRGTLTATSSAGVTVSGSATNRTLTGTLTTLNAFLAANKLSYTTALDDTASLTLTVLINDNGNTGSGGAKTDSRNVTLSVAAVNDAPRISAPGSLPVFSVGTSVVTGVSFSDVDAGNGTLEVTLIAPAVVTLSGGSTGTVTATGSGNTRVFSGRLVDLNAYFAAGNVGMSGSGFTGTGTLNITIDDKGNTGSGGAKSATANVLLHGGILFANGFE